MKLGGAKHSSSKAIGDKRERLDTLTPPHPPSRRNAPGAPEFPIIGPGEWVEALQRTEPHVEIVLSHGAFLWLWNEVEVRVAKWKDGLNRSALSDEFRAAYEESVFAALEELRNAASHHYRLVAPSLEAAKKSVVKTAKKGKPTKQQQPVKVPPKKLHFHTS